MGRIEVWECFEVFLKLVRLIWVWWSFVGGVGFCWGGGVLLGGWGFVGGGGVLLGVEF